MPARTDESRPCLTWRINLSGQWAFRAGRADELRRKACITLSLNGEMYLG